MKCARFSTLPARFVEKERRLHRILHHFPGFYVEGAARAPVLPKLCGGEFQKVNGDGTGPNNHEVAAQAGYNVVTTQAGAAALTAGAGKTLIIAENLADLTKVK